MADFDGIVVWVLRQEDSRLNGQIVDLHDGAGLTRFGLTQRDDAAYLPANFFTDMPAAAALEASKPVYRLKYWRGMAGDQISNDDSAASLFSFAVNGGEISEIELAQRALGLTPDGNVGPATIAALNDAGAGAKIRAAQAVHYSAIARNNPDKYGRFLGGWLTRANRIYPNI